MSEMNGAVEIRGNMYTLMSLVLNSTDHAAVVRTLHARVQQAPAFLSNVPVIVDFSQVSVSPAYNFNLLFKVIRQLKMLPVAVRGLPEHMLESLQSLGVPVVELNAARTARAGDEQPQYATPDTILGTPGVTLLISRSLQTAERCYAQDADLVVIGDCEPGAEIIADGHIHVYGALRGKAVCGFQGNRSARVFCREVSAEVVSIGGIGRTNLSAAAQPSGYWQIFLDRGEVCLAGT